MTQRKVTVLVDDIDGDRADETVRFALDGIGYEIDLRAANAARLRAIFQPYQAAGRRASRPATPRRGGRAGDDARARWARIRAWARHHGLQVSDRGRVPADVVAAYEANDPGQVTRRHTTPASTG